MGFFKNSFWSFANIAGGQLVNVLTNILLARLLYPEIFGVLGMAMVFTGLMLVFQEAGLSSYIIYKKNLQKKHITTSFWVNIAVSLVLFVAVYLLASPIAGFYNEPKVIDVLHFIAIGIFAGSFGISSKALLMKEKRFKSLTIVTLFGELCATAIAITSALLGYELLAISARLFIRPFIVSSVLLLIKGKEVLGKFEKDAALDILPYSGKVLGTQVSAFLINNVDYLLIGRLLGSHSLGIYTVAFQWSVLTRFYIAGAINKVSFSEISGFQDDLGRIKNLFLRLTKTLAFLTMPMCVGLALVANEFILVLYGEEWIDAVPILQVLIIAGGMQSLSSLSGSVFQGLGKPGIEFKISITSLVMLLMLIIIASQYGLIYIAYAVLLEVLIIDSIKFYFILKLLHIRVYELVRPLVPTLLSIVMMIVLVMAIKEILVSEFLLLNFILYVSTGIVGYVIGTYLFDKVMFKWVYARASKIVRKTAKSH
jgi:O-antigen/teichoic acid export membrane protein